MSEENVELVRSMYEAFNRRDWDSAFGLAAPDFEFTLQRGAERGPSSRARRSAAGHR